MGVARRAADSLSPGRACPPSCRFESYCFSGMDPGINRWRNCYGDEVRCRGAWEEEQGVGCASREVGGPAMLRGVGQQRCLSCLVGPLSLMEWTSLGGGGRPMAGLSRGPPCTTRPAGQRQPTCRVRSSPAAALFPHTAGGQGHAAERQLRRLGSVVCGLGPGGCPPEIIQVGVDGLGGCSRHWQGNSPVLGRRSACSSAPVVVPEAPGLQPWAGLADRCRTFRSGPASEPPGLHCDGVC